MWLDDRFYSFDKTLACNKRTDGETDRHLAIA